MTDITEILDTNAKSNWAVVYEHDCWIEKASEEIKRLRKDLSNSDYELNKALTGLERAEFSAEKALDWIESADHKFDCPRNRDDYDCTCGRDEVIQQLYGAFEGAQ